MLSLEEATERIIDYRGRTPPKTNAGVRLITAKVVKAGHILAEPKEFIAAAFYDLGGDGARALPRVVRRVPIF